MLNSTIEESLEDPWRLTENNEKALLKSPSFHLDKDDGWSRELQTIGFTTDSLKVQTPWTAYTSPLSPVLSNQNVQAFIDPNSHQYIDYMAASPDLALAADEHLPSTQIPVETILETAMRTSLNQTNSDDFIQIAEDSIKIPSEFATENPANLFTDISTRDEVSVQEVERMALSKNHINNRSNSVTSVTVINNISISSSNNSILKIDQGSDTIRSTKSRQQNSLSLEHSSESITFYQGAVYPKLTSHFNQSNSKKTSNPSKSQSSIFGLPFFKLFRSTDQGENGVRLNNIGLGLARKFGFAVIPSSNNSIINENLTGTVDVRKREVKVNDDARNQNVALTNISRLFTEILAERDLALEESDKLDNERSIVVDELHQLEGILREMKRQRDGLSVKLKAIVTRENEVNIILNDLDQRIGSISDETRLFETQLRAIKGNSSAKMIEFDNEEKFKDTRSCVLTLNGHKDSVEAISVDHPFGTLVSGSVDNTARIWDLSSGRCLAELQGHKGWVRSTGIQKNLVVTASNDSFIKIWDTSKIPALPPLINPLERVSLSSKPHFVARSDFSKLVEDNLDFDQEVFIGNLKGHSGGVNCIWFEDGKICSGSVDKTVRHWDVTTGKCLDILRTELWMDREIGMSKVDMMLYGTGNATPRLFEEPLLKKKLSIDEAIPGEDFGLWKSAGGSEKSKTISIFDDISSNSQKQHSLGNGVKTYNIGGSVGAVQFWHHALAAGYSDGLVRLFDLRSGECNRILDGKVSGGHVGAINSLQFDDITIITGSSDKTVKIWDLRTGTVIDTILFTAPVTSVAFDHRRILAAAGTNIVKVYNKSTGLISGLGDEVDGGWSGHCRPVRSVTISGDRVCSGGQDAIVKVFEYIS